MQKIGSCLWFDNQAEAAVKFYSSVFENTKTHATVAYTDSSAELSGQKKGSVMTVEFEIEGYPLIALNGGPLFKFTPALSLFVYCKTEEEITQLWTKLSAGGTVMMGLDKYPWAPKYGWTADQFGVQWQLILHDAPGTKIAPAFLFTRENFGKGEAALKLYESTFPNSKTFMLAKDEATNTIQHSSFSLNGQTFALMEGQGPHEFTFTNRHSIVVNCDTQEEIDHVWNALAEGGTIEQCGWLKDPTVFPGRSRPRKCASGRRTRRSSMPS